MPHQKESLANGWFKYPSGHWGRKFHYSRHSTPPPAKPTLVRPHTLFYLLTYMVGYYLLGRFTSLIGRFAYLGHLGHLAMVTVPIGSAITGLNLGALAHQIEGLFPIKWVPDRILPGCLPPAHSLLSTRYNFLSAYQLNMELPITPKPLPVSASKLSLDHTNKLFGIVYIPLTGVIDTIIPAAGPWSWVKKLMSYLIKLVPVLWWALPAKSVACGFPENDRLVAQGWFPDIALASSLEKHKLLVQAMIDTCSLYYKPPISDLLYPCF
ncbi:hypothetical protein DSO57_1022847 [Entomophthora muscae]|uniref:Uncharacterized protein n=1 Tax=Entomophthora muscae TaxID=34485 RepID=A0ACC2S4Z1_9FUNG|nr:hypothetical protein DSO57_1022847 [Entomophthora muscae]